MTFSDCASWLELNGAALRHNVQLYRELLNSNHSLFKAGQGGKTALLGVVLKANAYGHGLIEVLSVIHGLVDVVFVIAPQDALAIRCWERKEGKQTCRVVVIGAVGCDEAVELASNYVEVVVGDGGWKDYVSVLRKKLKDCRLKVHVHIDSGLGREGFCPDTLLQDIDFLNTSVDVFDVRGILSHFANTEDVTEQEYAHFQIDRFEHCYKSILKLLNIQKLERHFAATAATFLLPQAHFDVVRVGIGLYGLWPSAPARLSAKIVLSEQVYLEPVLSWHCKSQIVKTLPAGSYVGYGCTYRCPTQTRVAVFSVGYFDGYPRGLSGKAFVLVNGRRCPIVGRIMMNHIIVDVTNATEDNKPVVAVLMGKDASECISAEMLAEWGQTINYEIVARLSAHLERRLQLELTHFKYALPEDRIAQFPTNERTESRMLIAQRGLNIVDETFARLPEILQSRFDLKHDRKLLLIGNDSKVYPARVNVRRKMGGQAEVFLLEHASNKDNLYSCLLRPAKKLRLKEVLFAADATTEVPLFQVEDLENFKVSLIDHNFEDLLQRYACMPLPPYIRRDLQQPLSNTQKTIVDLDKERYQNIYSQIVGSSAAPTAGLHMTDKLLKECDSVGVEFCCVTLHVGLGTFQPVKTNNLNDHHMHSEVYCIGIKTLQRIREYVSKGWPVVFLGTTALRAVESFLRIHPLWNENSDDEAQNWLQTELFIRPRTARQKYFPCVGDGIITNFHQPESTLAMLIAALMGYDFWKEIYAHALSKGYRFLSYGDSSLLIFK